MHNIPRRGAGASLASSKTVHSSLTFSLATHGGSIHWGKLDNGMIPFWQPDWRRAPCQTEPEADSTSARVVVVPLARQSPGPWLC
jgi:hypothetical protein